MNKERMLWLVGSVSLVLALAPLHAGTLLVTDSSLGNIVEVDEEGNQSVFQSGLGRPYSLRGDQDGQANGEVAHHGDQETPSSGAFWAVAKIRPW